MISGTIQGWLTDEDLADVRAKVPITTIDVIPYRLEPLSKHLRITAVLSIGLIRRVSPWGEVWCWIGGRLCRGEQVAPAVRRQVAEALGESVVVGDFDSARPLRVTEFFPDPQDGAGLDPRQHGVSLAYAVPLRGEVAPQGEALGFNWFRDPFGLEIRLPFDNNFWPGVGEALRDAVAELKRRIGDPKFDDVEV